MSDANPKTGAPEKQRAFVVTPSKTVDAGARKPVTPAPAAAAKPKWVVKATVGQPVRRAADRTVAPKPSGAMPSRPMPAAVALPPNLEEIAVRLAKPMIREWLEESLPRMVGVALKGRVG